jgi:hypothetical protein
LLTLYIAKGITKSKSFLSGDADFFGKLYGKKGGSNRSKRAKVAFGALD